MHHGIAPDGYLSDMFILSHDFATEHKVKIKSLLCYKMFKRDESVLFGGFLHAAFEYLLWLDPAKLICAKIKIKNNFLLPNSF